MTKVTHKTQPIAQVVLKMRDGSEEVMDVAEDGHVLISIATITDEGTEDMALKIRQRVMAGMQTRMAMIESMKEDALEAMKSELPEGLQRLLGMLEDVLKD